VSARENTHQRRDFATQIRSFLWWLLSLELAGTLAELILEGHTEDPLQWTPLILIALAFAVLAWQAATGAWRNASHDHAGSGRASVRAMQALMILFVISGFVGIGLHLKGKMEFKKETDPSLSGFKLFTESLHTKVPPALAPGVMIQMGLLGLAYAWRHPALGMRKDDAP
jgi:hypothetical protein